MSEELKYSFDILNINQKRNEISNELLTIYELIKTFEINNEIQPITTIKNYDPFKDKDLTEAEILTYFYEDIYNIQQELITLLKVLNK